MTHAVNLLLSLSMIGVGAWGVIRLANWLEQRAVAELNGGKSS